MEGAVRNHFWSHSKSKVNSQQLNFIVLDDQPLSVVENVGFRSLIEHLQPWCSLPSRGHLLETALPELYNQVSTKLAEKLKAVPAYSDLRCLPSVILAIGQEEFISASCKIIIVIIILKQTELRYRNSIGICRYPNSGIGI